MASNQEAMFPYWTLTMNKQLVRIEVPEELVAFFGDVVSKLDSAPCLIPSDDLLQCDFAYGGMYEENGEECFGFTYFSLPRLASAKYPRRWFICLSQEKLKRIAKGELKTIDLWRCDPDCGNRFSEENAMCRYCDY